MEENMSWKEILIFLAKTTLVIVLGLFFTFFSPALIIVGISLVSRGLHPFFLAALALVFIGLIPLLFLKKRKGYLKVYIPFTALVILGAIGNMHWHDFDQSRVIDTNPNIEIYKYYPGYENNLLVELPEDASLRFLPEEELPRIDGATAVFPVYSAFVKEVYPEGTMLSQHRVYDDQGTMIQDFYNDTPYCYNNTVGGYTALADGQTDVFFGAYPSQEQLDYAKTQHVVFEFTPIGYEAFVFFVHKDNPVDSLTVEQIQDIYAGKITNWAQVGGNFEPIRAYQRNANSGSQSQLIRFMDGKALMDPPSELRSGGMGGIIESVSDYRSSTASIGFSFRYYVEVMVANPDIKILKVNGVAPTMENIHSGAYPIVGPLYAVTRESNKNPNVQKLLDWILSPEGQYIIQETGYTPVTPVS